ncbi:gpi anchored serine-threonine rich [Fusarium longipes]|uniref:Gpi anchored serine-threonine rich n=1 Tax=Fusarium longipes TaxID=694270 RepID=A0A395T2S9_9HYPO|nr:gpi anchored serine-threonine rich [Fusarium longipes]
MKYILLLLSTITTLVSATSPFLARRQDLCGEGSKVCGTGCIPNSYTCCRDFSSGCQPGTRCGIDDNGDPGCCPIGRVCTGDGGGISTYDIDEPISTSYEPTIIADEPTATVDKPGPTDTEDSTDDSKGPATTHTNAGVFNRLDGTVSYLMVGAMALLF